MSDERIKEDKSILPKAGEPADLGQPFLILGKMPGEDNFRIGFAVEGMDPSASTPEIYGIVLSDVVDQIAAAYHAFNGSDPGEVRATIHRVIRDEEEMKRKDPRRGRGRGATIWNKGRN